MCRASAGDNHVSRIECGSRSVGVQNGDLPPLDQRHAGQLREAGIDLDGGNLAGGPHELGSDCAVVTGSAPQMQDMLADAEVQLVKQSNPQTRLTVVDAARRVQ